MKSSYQHIAEIINLLLFAILLSQVSAQPHAPSHQYIGLTSLSIKNKNPNELLRFLNNNGYPYAHLQLDSLSEVTVPHVFIWNVYLGKRITLDTLTTTNSLFNNKTLQRCINYKIGELYSSEKIEAISAALNQLSFLKPNTQVIVGLHSETFSLSLKTERKKNNVLSALFALQPKPNSTVSMLTGNIDLEISNALKQAEIIEFHWKRPQPKSQSLGIKLGSPFTAGLPIGFQFEFASFLRDSTFSSTDVSLRLLTKSNDLNGFSAAVSKSSNTHFSSSSSYGNTTNKTYSLRYSKYSNSTNSINFLIEGLTGNRTIQYESNATSKKLHAFKGKIWSKYNLNKFIFTNLNFEVNALFSDSLYNNEIPRLGGTKNLRAFIEESIYASQYAMLNCDFGVTLGPEIQSFIFGDIVKIQAPISTINYDTGLGFRFQQENGDVSITYGVGNIENNGLQLKNGRVGITFSSRF